MSESFDLVQTADLDDNGVDDAEIYDTDGDNEADVAVVDVDEDGYADAVIADTDGDGEFDTTESVDGAGDSGSGSRHAPLA